MLFILTLPGCVTISEPLGPPGLVCYEQSYKITCVMPEIVPAIEVPE